MTLDEQITRAAHKVADGLQPPEVDLDAVRARARSNQRRTASLAVAATVMAVIAVGATVVGSREASAPAPVGPAGDGPTSAATEPDCPSVAFHHDDLAPGCWAIQVRGLFGSPLAELSLPAGFSGNDAWVWVNADKEDEWGAITLVSVGDVYANPCTRAGNPPKVGPSVADFARALAAQKVTIATRPVPVSLDGHDGVYLEMSVPKDFDLSGCRGKEMISWEAGEESGGSDPGYVDRYWVLDVDGQRVVLAVVTADDATDETVELVTGIAESANFDEG